MQDGRHHHPAPESDPEEKVYADVVEETIVVASSIEEEMLIEAAEIEQITYRVRPVED